MADLPKCPVCSRDMHEWRGQTILTMEGDRLVPAHVIQCIGGSGGDFHHLSVSRDADTYLAAKRAARKAWREQCARPKPWFEREG